MEAVPEIGVINIYRYHALSGDVPTPKIIGTRIRRASDLALRRTRITVVHIQGFLSRVSEKKCAGAAESLCGEHMGSGTWTQIGPLWHPPLRTLDLGILI